MVPAELDHPELGAGGGPVGTAPRSLRAVHQAGHPPLPVASEPVVQALAGDAVALRVKGAQTSVRSCRGAVVLVDEPAEPVPSPHLLPRSRSRVSLSLRRIELQPAVGTLPVVPA